MRVYDIGRVVLGSSLLFKRGFRVLVRWCRDVECVIVMVSCPWIILTSISSCCQCNGEVTCAYILVISIHLANAYSCGLEPLDSDE